MNLKTCPSKLGLLLSLSLLLLPIGPVMASHGLGPLITTNPSNIEDNVTVPRGTVIPGYAFTLNVVLDEIGTFNAYDISLRYDTTILTAEALTLLPVQGQTFVELIPTVLDDSTGTVSVSAGLTEGRTVTVTGSDPVFSVNFVVDAFGRSPLDVTNDKVVLGGDSIPHGTQDGMVTTFPEPQQTHSRLIRHKAWPENHNFKISAGGQQTLFAIVQNTGLIEAQVKAGFAVSIGGDELFVPSNPVTLMPGETARVEGSFVVSVPGVYSVVAIPFSSAEGVVFFAGENSKSFSFHLAG